jgi:hypothetical protein
MEYWVTIAIPNAEETLAESILEALTRKNPETCAVMDLELASGRTSFVLGIEADNPLAASSAGVEIFAEALTGAGAHSSDMVEIIDLHAEPGPDDELPRSELQTA